GGRRFKLLGSDCGLLPAPVDATAVLLTPGDRVDLAVGPFEEGETLAIDSLPYNRGAGRARTARFATLHVGPPAPSLPAIPAHPPHIEPLASRDATPPRTIRLGTRLSLRHGVDWLVDDEAHHQDDPVPVGELQVWEVVNETRMDHPFHLHG